MSNPLRTGAILIACAALLSFCTAREDIRPESVAGAGGGGSPGASGTAAAVVAGMAGASGMGGASAGGASQAGGAAGTDAAGGSPGGMAGAGGDGKSGAAGKTHSCPTGLPGPALVEVTGPDGTAYCIDRTEVTQAQYLSFIKAKNGDVSGQPPECALNTSWVPKIQAAGDMGSPSDCPQGYYDPVGAPDRPMLCANWCKAKAYCAWAGKRLCGKIGGGPLAGALDAGGASQPAGEWYNACSQGGKTTYPYGDTYEPAACNGADNPTTGSKAPPQPAAASSACRGNGPPFDQILDMSGNVDEWEDSCAPSGFTIFCRLRGGAFADDQPSKMLRCGSNAGSDVISSNQATGIRCCAD